MAATAAVLDTCELLEHIISFLPAGDIGKVQRVSNTWQELIQSSKIIQRVRVLRPCNEANLDWNPSRWINIEETYITETPIIFHPAVSGFHPKRIYYKGIRQTTVTVYITVGDSQRHDHDGDRMLTNPPISRASVFSPCSGPCEMYSPKGLTLRDAFEVVQAVASMCRYDRGCIYKKGSASVQVSVVGAEAVIKGIK